MTLGPFDLRPLGSPCDPGAGWLSGSRGDPKRVSDGEADDEGPLRPEAPLPQHQGTTDGVWVSVLPIAGLLGIIIKTSKSAL